MISLTESTSLLLFFHAITFIVTTFILCGGKKKEEETGREEKSEADGAETTPDAGQKSAPEPKPAPDNKPPQAPNKDAAKPKPPAGGGMAGLFLFSAKELLQL